MPAAFSADAAAASLLAARTGRRPIPLPSPGPASAADAFAIQARVAAHLGPAGAWKVGRGPASAPFTAAPIAKSHVRASPCTWPAGDFLRLGIEVEIAVRLGRDLPAGADEAAVRDAIAAVHAAIEIVDSRFDTWPVPDPLWALADNQNNGGLVLDPDGRPPSGEPLGRGRVELKVDGETVFSGEGANPAGDPLPLVALLAGHLAPTGGLAAETIVTLGSLSGILFVEPGARVEASVAGIGRVALSLPA